MVGISCNVFLLSFFLYTELATTATSEILSILFYLTQIFMKKYKIASLKQAISETWKYFKTIYFLIEKEISL